MDFPYGLLLIALLQGVTCQQWSVGLPSHIRALQGSCVVIPCHFTYPGTSKTDEQFRVAWCLYNVIGYPEVFNNKNEENVIETFKGRTELVGRSSHGNCSLRINNVRKDDADKYYPLIDRETSDFWFWETTTDVQVSDTPEKLTLPSPGRMTERMPVTITCSAEHTCPSSPPTLAWDKFQHNISVHHTDLGSGRWRTVLMLNYYPAAKDHTKFITCKATYPNGKTNSETISFFIWHRPYGMAAAVVGNTKIKEGDTVTLSCSCKGSVPNLKKYSWYEGQRKAALPVTGQTITVSNISWDSGPYFCSAQNVVGIGESAPLELDIHYAPKGTYIIPPAEDHIKEGYDMILTCATKSSYPAVTHYTWNRDQIELETQTEQTLKVEQIAVKDSGNYSCVAYNEVGHFSSAPFNVIVERSATELYAALVGTAAAILLILLALLIVIFIRKGTKKALMPAVPKNPLSERVETHEEILMADNLYGNIDNYIHVTDHSPGSHTQEYPDLINPEATDSGLIYSQVRTVHEQEENADPEELNYSTIQHFQSRRTHQTDAQQDDFVEYASVKK